MSGNQVSDILAQAIAAEGVDTVFTLMGDANMHWSNAMAKHNGVRLMHVRHEHCACTAAISYAWATGKPGVASVTCGPGRISSTTKGFSAGCLAISRQIRMPWISAL